MSSTTHTHKSAVYIAVAHGIYSRPRAPEVRGSVSVVAGDFLFIARTRDRVGVVSTVYHTACRITDFPTERTKFPAPPVGDKRNPLLAFSSLFNQIFRLVAPARARARRIWNRARGNPATSPLAIKSPTSAASREHWKHENMSHPPLRRVFRSLRRSNEPGIDRIGRWSAGQPVVRSFLPSFVRGISPTPAGN